jgi:uncharacterized lipoprotein YddW (UPF0748 family)
MHVWMVNFNLLNAPPEFVAKLRAAGRTQKDAKGEDVNWLCPSHPENLALERDSMLEVVRNYGVDGIHFDYIRYLNKDVCFCAGCRERFEAAAGVNVEQWPQDMLTGKQAGPFGDWRREQITRLVRAVSQEAHKIKPGIRNTVRAEWHCQPHPAADANGTSSDLRLFRGPGIDRTLLRPRWAHSVRDLSRCY